MLQPNLPQQIFALFYAIFWGTAANAQPRWKAFPWAAFWTDTPSRNRVSLSVLLMDFLPILYFVFLLWMLRVWDISDWTLASCMKIFASVVAGFAPFGFYRVWTSIVEFWAPAFYGAKPSRESHGAELGNQGHPR